ncbi:MAG: UPF0058 family protein [Candidatus Aenigmarchaeota archaeon]|nr:UPF0058 family protein [Candidatus Aenigmarchaeota archaeon]
MLKKELIQLHAVFAQVKNYIEMHEGYKEFFQAYANLNITPQDYHTTKNEQKGAVFVLSYGISLFLKMETNPNFLLNGVPYDRQLTLIKKKINKYIKEPDSIINAYHSAVREAQQRNSSKNVPQTFYTHPAVVYQEIAAVNSKV